MVLGQLSGPGMQARSASPPSRAPRWEVWILNSADAPLAHVDDALSWSYSRLSNQVSTATVRLPAASGNAVHLRTPGARLSIRIGYWDATGAWMQSEDWGGRILRRTYIQPDTGVQEATWECTAFHWMQWLRERLVFPTGGQEGLDLDATYTDIAMKTAFNACLGPAAIAERRITGLTAAANANQGAASKYTARYARLYDVITALAGQGAVAFDIVRVGDPGAATWLFQTWDTRQGTDRSVVNTGGNASLTFSLDLQTLASLNYTEDESDMANRVEVGGSGEGVLRGFSEVDDTASIAIYGLRERMVDARNATTSAKRIAEGRAALADSALPEQGITVKLPPIYGNLYRRDWSLGDRVTVEIPELDVTLHPTITEVKVASEASAARPVVSVTFGKIDTILDRIARIQQAVALQGAR